MAGRRFERLWRTLAALSLVFASVVFVESPSGAAPGDLDDDGLLDVHEDANTDGDFDPSTLSGPDTDSDGTANYLDADDDGDGAPTASEEPDPNADGDPRDARDTDRDGQPDYLDMPTGNTDGIVKAEQKISSLFGGLTGPLDGNDLFGSSVTSIGDLDGDGVNDIAVGATGDEDGFSNAGAVYILFLNPNGTVKAEQKISSLFGGLALPLAKDDFFGTSISGIGDLDGDGINDIAVGATGDEDGFSNAGAVYILFLNPNGTVKAEQKISSLFGGLTPPLDGNDLFGSSVTSVGDLDGDGVNDLAVGATGDDDGASQAGAAYILFLNPDGTVKGEQKISAASGGLTGPLVTDDFFGTSISGIGDLDGDGINDIAVGATGDEDGFSDAGATYIMFLNPDGTVKAEQKVSAASGGLTGPLEKDDFFGTSISGIGDLDGNGAIDLLVGATGDEDASSDAGAAYILFLNPNGTVKGEQKISSLFGGLTGPLEKDDFFGASISGIGDLDGDGAIDLLVGATGDDDVTGETGALYVLQLAPTAHTVNSTTDISDANLLDGLCDTGSTNSQGAPSCSLRAAIEQANATNGSERIEFDLPSTEAGYTGSYWTVQPTSILPQIVETVQIDGTTQPGYSSAPLINIDGAMLAGAGDGLFVAAGADATRISGLALSAFPYAGIVVDANAVSISDNHVGVRPDGATAAGNLAEGIIVASTASGTTIRRNVVGANRAAGVVLNATSTGTIITGNLIGTDATGLIDLGNEQGIWADTSGTAIIGGDSVGDGNTIAYSMMDGIELQNSGLGISVLGNSIFNNGQLGINAVDPGDPASGVTPNDSGDGDTGPNGLLNFPVVTSSSISGSIVTLAGTYDVPAGSYRFEVFSNPAGGDASGFGEGGQYVGTSTLTHTGSGAEGWGLAFVGTVGDELTLTLTEDLGNGSYGATSEFSAVEVIGLVLVVNSTSDSGDNSIGDGTCDTGATVGADPECTLRAAIEEANAFAGDEAIRFAIPTGDAGYTASPLAFTIAPSSLLPAISTPMTIDGSTQSQYSTEGRPVIEIDGTNVSAAEENGLYLTGGGATIRGLVINNWGDDGIDIEFNGGNTIVGNYIGTNVTGTAAQPNAWGINFKTGANIIGGTNPTDRNVVSGNTNDGLYIYTAAATGNVVQGNYVGTNAAGTAAVANGRYGLYIWSGANGNTIGGATPAHGNVVSGNGTGEGGILIDGAATSGNTIRHNFIGTNAAGDAAIPNNLHGLAIDDAPNTQVLDNLISGNDGHGIYLNNSNNNTIQTNSIGTDSGGSVDLGNTLTGIYIDVLGSSDNLIGGAVAGDGNTIAFNAEGITFVSGTDNAIIGNDIYTNDSLGIDFDNDGVTTNSNADAWLNYPAITSAVAGAGTITIDFDLEAPAGDYRIELFKNPGGADPSGFGEGQNYVDTYDIVAHPGGVASYNTTTPGIVGDIITTTATEDFGGALFGATSEFSATATVAPVVVLNQAPTIAPIGSQSSAEGQTFTITPAASDPDIPADTLTWSVTGLPAGFTLNPSSGVITGTATYIAAAGSPYSIDLTVDDGNGGSDTVTFAWTVTDTNRAPSMTPISDLSGDELVPVSISFAASDPDTPADTVTLTATGLPSGATFDTPTRTFQWTPTEAQGPGTYSITITATDDGSPNLSSSITFNIAVGEINTAPVLAPIASVNVDPLSTVSFTAAASDSDAPANALTFSATGLPPGASLNSASGLFEWTPGAAGANSNHAITVTVTDSGGMTDSQSFTIGVNGSTTTTTTPAPTTTTSSAPTTTTTGAPTTTPTAITTAPSDNQTPVAGPFFAPSIAEHQQISYRMAASDPDGDALVFGLIDAPAGLRIGRTTGIIVWTPTESQGPRRHDFSVRVSDGSSSDLIVPVSINVLEVNDTPTLASPTKQIVAVGSSFTYGLAATDIDVPNNTLRYSVVDGPVGLTVNPETGMISWIPQPSDGGQTVTVRVRVDDNGTPARGTTTSFELEVSPDALPFTHVIVRGDTFATSYGQAILLDVLANDVGRDLKIESVTQPASGTATVRDDGIWFEPAIGFAGVISIEYVAVGSDGSTGTASVMIEVASPRLNDVDNSINIDLWDYTPAASVAEPLTFSGVGSAMIDALSGLRIPTRLLILSGAWVFVFSLSVTRITRQWKFAAISNVPRGESVQMLSWTGTKTRFRFRHDADLLWVSARRIRRHGAWYRRVETPAGKGLIPDEYVDDMLDVYLDGRA